MTFETLAYIHRLLEKEEAYAKRALATRTNRYSELIDEEAPEDEIKDADTFLTIAIRHHTEALRALTEFNEHEWR